MGLPILVQLDWGFKRILNFQLIIESLYCIISLIALVFIKEIIILRIITASYKIKHVIEIILKHGTFLLFPIYNVYLVHVLQIKKKVYKTKL